MIAVAKAGSQLERGIGSTTDMPRIVVNTPNQRSPCLRPNGQLRGRMNRSSHCNQGTTLSDICRKRSGEIVLSRIKAGSQTDSRPITICTETRTRGIPVTTPVPGGSGKRFKMAKNVEECRKTSIGKGVFKLGERYRHDGGKRQILEDLRKRARVIVRCRMYGRLIGLYFMICVDSGHRLVFVRILTHMER